ncbi:hypothetical protein CDD82_2352 [Ophiocordyceps australis]|uniref:glycerophosphodiester phosphodiesterase n=1 Tax=Ophiocordyceps australis TaxID=1399860 RepID=A0A2C5XEW7_9HYPO|nr:hypothetical protein CDD82_2352 [Ophiocordyceps australis]
MRCTSSWAAIATGLVAAGLVAGAPCASSDVKPIRQIELGPRPYFLVNNMTAGPLKDKLAGCSDMDVKPSAWSIGHRGGAPLQFPEHSREANLAGARMGAGTIECDVSFTKDRQLVCRHSQCDLHTTTNIVAIEELNAKCTKPFEAAGDGKAASAMCCTSDVTLAEFKSLCAKMDGFNASATTAHDFLGGTPNWRTDLYATCGTLLDHHEHIALIEGLGLAHSPELKAPSVPMPFDGNYTLEAYRRQMIDNYIAAGVPASRVRPQSFSPDDVRFWLAEYPDYGNQSMLLDETEPEEEAVRRLEGFARDGIRTMAPPMQYLVHEAKGGGDGGNKMEASEYARRARELGLGLITWSLERSGPLAAVRANGDYYYANVRDVVTKDGDMYEYVDVLWNEVGVEGLFSDWSATATFYANCMGVGEGGSEGP